VTLRRESTKGKPRSFDAAGCAALLDGEITRAIARLREAIDDLGREIAALEAERERRTERRRERSR
jgi:hypothetical protein